MKQFSKILVVLGLIVLAGIFLYSSFLVFTINSRIVEDSLLLELVCKVRPLCQITPMSYYCDENYNNQDWINNLPLHERESQYVKRVEMV